MIQLHSQFFIRLAKFSTSVGNRLTTQFLLFSNSHHSSERYVQEDEMAIDFAIFGVDCRNNCDGLYASGQLKGPGVGDAHRTDNLLLFVYLFLCPFWKEDT